MEPVRGAGNVAYSLRRYLSIKSAYSPEFSPDDQRIAYLSDMTGVPQIWMTRLFGDRAPQQITLEDERVGFLSFAAKSERMTFGIDRGGSERFQIHLLEEGGDSVVNLTDEPEVIHNWGDWSPDETAITFSSNARNQEYFDIYIQELDDRSVEMVHRYDGNAYPVTWSPDGAKILFEVSHAPFDHDLFLLDISDKSAELLTPHDGDAAFYSPTFDATGKFVYCATDKDREFAAIARIDVGSHELEYLYAEDWDVEGLSATRDKETIAFTVNDGGASRLMVWDLGNETPVELPLPTGQIGGLDWSNDGKKLAFSLSSSSANSDIRVFEFEMGGSPRGNLSRLTTSSTCGIPASSFVEPELVKTRSFDELEVPSYLYLPKAEVPPFPLIVYLHGGPESQFRPGFSPLMQFFVKLGFAVLATNFRGSTGYGRRFTHLDDVKGRMDTVRDAELALRHVLEKYPIDKRKVAAWGGSYGGFMVLACLYSNPGLWAAGVDIVGISNFVTFLKNTGPWRRKLRIAEYGDPEKDKQFLESISPSNNAHLIKSPLHHPRDQRPACPRRRGRANGRDPQEARAGGAPHEIRGRGPRARQAEEQGRGLHGGRRVPDESRVALTAVLSDSSLRLVLQHAREPRREGLQFLPMFLHLLRVRLHQLLHV
jgi:dipeptidyl aminopeptidase/acylaminoacyl peptidase